MINLKKFISISLCSTFLFLFAFFNVFALDSFWAFQNISTLSINYGTGNHYYEGTNSGSIVDGHTNFSNSKYSNVNYMIVRSEANINENTYCFFKFNSQVTDFNSDFTFFPSEIAIQLYDDNGDVSWYTLSSEDIVFRPVKFGITQIEQSKTNYYQGFACYFDLKDFFNTGQNAVLNGVKFTGSGSVGKNLSINFSIYNGLPSNIDDEFNSILSELQKQTALQIAIDNGIQGTITSINDNGQMINYSVQHGNEDTGGLVDDNNQASEQLNSVITQYDDFEQTFQADFIEHQTAVNSQFTGWSWFDIQSGANWLTDTLQGFFTRSGFFQNLFVFPILVGMALMLIGLGDTVLHNNQKKQSRERFKNVMRK